MNSRRRFTLSAIVAAMALSIAACSGPDPTLSSSLSPTHQPSASAQPSPTALASTTPSPTPSPSAAPSPTKQATPSAAPKPTKTSKPSKPTRTPNPSTSTGRWKPKAGLTWQWQLSGKLDTTVNAQVYDVDLFDTSTSQVKQLQSKGRKVICYFSAGSYESGRPDSGDFPSAVKGSKMDGWPEYWLDIRDKRVLDIMAGRLDLCAKKGFDGVEADNVDGYQNDSGFALSASDQLAYNKALAKLAHARGLAIGLKNDLDQVSSLQSSFDFAVNEECYEYDECGVLKAFINAGKPVFHVEYSVPIGTFCPTTTKLGFSSMRKNLDLDASRTPCP
jgi:hypothetical protein